MEKTTGPEQSRVICSISVVARSTRQWWAVQHINNNCVAPRTPASWPHQVGTIPPQAACFQDRTEVARLTAALASGGTAVVTPTMPPVGVVAGLDGVGKTQLVAHYARTLWQAGELDVLVWITASSREAVPPAATWPTGMG